MESFYRTTDLALAAAVSMFVPIEDINRQNPRRVEFIFERNSKLEKLLKRYWNNQLEVEPKKYFNQLKILKSRLYGQE